MDDRNRDLDPYDHALLTRVAARVWPGAVWSAERSAEGLTNSNWFIRLEGLSEPRYFVQRAISEELARSVGIDRVVKTAAEEFAVRSGIAPATVAVLADEAVVVTEFIPSTGFPGAGIERGADIAEAAALLRQLHSEPFSSDVMGRMSGDVLRYVHARGKELAVTGSVPTDLSWAVSTLQRVCAVYPAVDPCVIHFDPRAGNFLKGERLFLIDWEYARVGDPFYDLGSFAYYVDLSPEEECHLVHSYFGAEDETALQRVRLMRFVGALSEAIFGISMQRRADAPSDFDYAEYAADQLRAARDIARKSNFVRALKTLKVGEPNRNSRQERK